jgi:hypothetical protein
MTDGRELGLPLALTLIFYSSYSTLNYTYVKVNHWNAAFGRYSSMSIGEI